MIKPKLTKMSLDFFKDVILKIFRTKHHNANSAHALATFRP